MKELEVLKSNDMTIEELAYQLTAYEKWGFIDYEDGICDLLVSDFLEEAETSELIWKYNEYLDINGYYDDMYYYNDDEFFNTYFYNNPAEAVRASYYGDYNYNDEYVRFNAYGNLESANGYILKDEIKRDTDFINWVLENEDVFSELLKEENKTLIINEALKLVKAGY